MGSASGLVRLYPARSGPSARGVAARGAGLLHHPPMTDPFDFDHFLALPRLSASRRTALMGGSFGGYMANWVAGHTDRFRAVVTHASLWALDQFGPTTDAAWYWLREMTPQMAQANSPHLHLENIVTPMLVIHGDRDYRVPIGDGLRLWFELVQHSADENGRTPHRFLYFPDENHWILKPQNSRLWYETVLAFLDHHALGREWVRPALV